jgi:type I restriction enzyme, S subunit
MKRLKIKDAFHSIRNGANIKQDKSLGGIPITRIESISDSVIDLNKLGYAGIVDDSLSDYYLKDGDILMSHINSVSHLGKVAIYENRTETIIHGMNLLCLKANKNILYPRYAFYFFRSPFFINSIKPITKKSVNQASFNISNFLNLSINLPDKFEDQIRIATLLSKAEVLIKQRKESIDLLDEYLKSTFLEMFGDPLKNEKRWNVERLDKISKLERGRFSPRPRNDPSYFDGKYPFIQTGDISRSGNRLTNYTQTLNEKGIKVSKQFKKGTIVIAIVGATIGATSICGIDVYATDSIIGITANEMFTNNLFLEFTLRLLKPYLLSIAPEAARANINLEILNKLAILSPPIELQNQFANIVEKTETLKAQYQSSLAELENWYGSLSQKAFKGELNLSKLSVYYEEEYSASDNDRTEPHHFNKPINLDTISVEPTAKRAQNKITEFSTEIGNAIIKNLAKQMSTGFSFQEYVQKLKEEKIIFTKKEIIDFIFDLLKSEKLVQFYASKEWMYGINEVRNIDKEYKGDEGNIWFLATVKL